MKWFITETSVEGTDATFGPFDSMQKALAFASNNKFPWSEDFLCEIKIEKKAVH